MYPLLGAAIYGWSFVATDIDDTSVALAKANVARNERLSERVEVQRVERGTMLVGNVRDDEVYGSEHTAHSTQHTVHSIQPYNTQHTAHSANLISLPLVLRHVCGTTYRA